MTTPAEAWAQARERAEVLNLLEGQRQCAVGLGHTDSAEAYAAAIALLRAALPPRDAAVRDVFWREFAKEET